MEFQGLREVLRARALSSMFGSILSSPTQEAQYPLNKEYSLDHKGYIVVPFKVCSFMKGYWALEVYSRDMCSISLLDAEKIRTEKWSFPI